MSLEAFVILWAIGAFSVFMYHLCELGEPRRGLGACVVWPITLAVIVFREGAITLWCAVRGRP